MTASAQPALNEDQIAYWNGPAGERWAELQGRIDSIFSPLTEAALDFAEPQRGARVLDIGCGAGATVVELAQAVGPTGHVLGVDVSEPMLAVAAARITRHNLGQADVLLADAATHSVTDRFDLAFSRFGVMFFDDPTSAFTNLRAALAPGGRLTFVCWQALERNPWFAVPMAALLPLLPPSSPADPFAPGPFAFADADRVRGILEAAGFVDVAAQPCTTTMRLGSLDAAAAFLQQIGPAARALHDADPQARPALLAALRNALADHDGPDGIVLGAAVWHVSARAP